MSNDEARNNDETRMFKNEAAQLLNLRFAKSARRTEIKSLDHSGLFRHSSFVLRHCNAYAVLLRETRQQTIE